MFASASVHDSSTLRDDEFKKTNTFDWSNWFNVRSETEFKMIGAYQVEIGASSYPNITKCVSQVMFVWPLALALRR